MRYCDIALLRRFLVVLLDLSNISRSIKLNITGTESIYQKNDFEAACSKMRKMKTKNEGLINPTILDSSNEYLGT